MGFLDVLATAAPIAANAVGTEEHAQAQAANTKAQQVIQAVLFQRQQRQMDADIAYKNAQAGEAQAGTVLKTNQASPEWNAAKAGGEARATADAQWPTKERELRTQLENGLALERARGATEASIAAMRLQGERDIAQLHVQSAASLQSNQQNFLQGQQQRALAGQRTNRIAEIGALGNNSIMTTIGRGLHILPPPSTGPATAPQQQQDWDLAAKHITDADPTADPAATLGPRP